jgi:DNA repair protein SbcD/Mre11
VLRLLHTSDWHLGHTLYDLPRRYEHERFLAWLGDVLEREAIDALIVAGDIFDGANPPADAQEQFYGFLAKTRARLPKLELVVVGGNHDSAARLDAPDPLLRALGIHVVGGLPRRGGELDTGRLLVPLRNRSGEVEAWVAAVPFLRPVDLPRVDDSGVDPLVEGMRRAYAEVLDAARARLEPGQALIATGHCYMVGTALSELSERRILGGNQHALPVDIFPSDVAYVALGHLHKAQQVGGQDRVRYSGSPIPLSMSERGYRHQVRIVEIEGGKLANETRAIEVPRSVDLLSIPNTGAASIDELLTQIAALPARRTDTNEDARPYLQVEVLLEKPTPTAKQLIEEAARGKEARLVRIGQHTTGLGQALGEMRAMRTLSDITPDEVFSACYERTHATAPPAELVEAFHVLVERAQHEASR